MRRSLFAFVALVGLVACDNITDPDEPGTPVNLSFAPCVGSQGAPTWFAFQDGNGSWTRATATSSGAFNFTLSSGRGGIATYAPGDGLFVLYATTAELQANVPSCSGTVRNVSGTVTGYASLDNIRILMNNSQATVFGSQAAPAPFTLDAVESNVSDLVAVRYRTSASAATFEAFPTNVFIRRGVSGSSTPLIDFASGTEAGAPLQRSVTVTNLSAGEELQLYSNIVTSTTVGNIAVYEAASAISGGSVVAPFYGLAAAANRLVSGESQSLAISATRTVNATSESRFGALVYTDVADKQFTFGPSLGAVSISGSSRPSASYSIQTGYDNLWDVVFEQGSGASFRQLEVLMTRAYLGTGSMITLAVPDLSGVSGFQSSWLLIPGSMADWSFLATNGDLSILNNKAVAYVGADRSSTFVP
ncbi:MAG: hypothetical protein ABIR92_06120 [Gemmatimonadaceae bacterium]